MKNEKSKIITIIGMAVMIIAVAVKAATGSVIAAAAITVAGLACFFITEGTDLDRQELKNLGNMRFPRLFLCVCIILQREGDGFPVKLFQNIKEGSYAVPLVIFMGAQNAGEAFLAVKRDPCKLPAVIVQKTGSQADTASGRHVCQCGVMISTVKVFDLP